jgi:hypothetical protein
MFSASRLDRAENADSKVAEIPFPDNLNLRLEAKGKALPVVVPRAGRQN